MTAGSLVPARRRSAMRQRDDSESRKVVRVESDWPDTTMNAEEFSRSPSAGGVSDFLAGGGDGGAHPRVRLGIFAHRPAVHLDGAQREPPIEGRLPDSTELSENASWQRFGKPCNDGRFASV